MEFNYTTESEEASLQETKLTTRSNVKTPHFSLIGRERGNTRILHKFLLDVNPPTPYIVSLVAKSKYWKASSTLQIIPTSPSGIEQEYYAGTILSIGNYIPQLCQRLRLPPNSQRPVNRTKSGGWPAFGYHDWQYSSSDQRKPQGPWYYIPVTAVTKFLKYEFQKYVSNNVLTRNNWGKDKDGLITIKVLAKEDFKDCREDLYEF